MRKNNNKGPIATIRKPPGCENSAASPAPKSPRPHDYGNCTTPIYNFDEGWPDVERHIKTPFLQGKLTECMNNYFAYRAKLSSTLDRRSERWNIQYDPTLGPFHYADSVDLADWLKRDDSPSGICTCCGKEHRYMLTNSNRWFYYIPQACPWLAVWQATLGEFMFPKLRWTAVSDGRCGLAYGIDLTDKVRVIFDMFHDRSGDEAMAFVRANEANN